MKIKYFFEGVDEFSAPLLFEQWVSEIEKQEKKSLKINYIFVNNEEILRINNDFLQHNYYTDIITFDLSELPNEIKSDIFISVDTVKENAEDRKIAYKTELTRVMAHGILHLIGFNDKTDEDQEEMTKQEDIALEKILNVSRETL